jgi:hypothetical protein
LAVEITVENRDYHHLSQNATNPSAQLCQCEVCRAIRARKASSSLVASFVGFFQDGIRLRSHAFRGSIAGVQTCSICGAPREVRDAVNDAHEKGSTLREIQKLSGGTLSRASLSRHFRKCLNKMRVSSMAFTGGRLVVVYPNEHGEYIDPPGTRPEDIALEVHYEKPIDMVARAAEVAAVKAKAAAREAAEVAAAEAVLKTAETTPN